MKFVIRINEDVNGEPGDEEIITDIEGNFVSVIPRDWRKHL